MSESKNTEHCTSIFTLAKLPIRMVIYLSVFGAFCLAPYIRNQDWFYDKELHIYRVVNIEAKAGIIAINRVQQNYHLKHQKFANSITTTGLPINIETGKYSYRIVQPMKPVQDLSQSAIYHDRESMIMAIAYKNIKENTPPNSLDDQLKNYLGVLYTLPQTSASGETEIITRAALCQMTVENPLPTTMPKLINGYIQCPNGARKIHY